MGTRIATSAILVRRTSQNISLRKSGGLFSVLTMASPLLYVLAALSRPHVLKNAWRWFTVHSLSAGAWAKNAAAIFLYDAVVVAGRPASQRLTSAASFAAPEAFGGTAATTAALPQQEFIRGRGRRNRSWESVSAIFDVLHSCCGNATEGGGNPTELPFCCVNTQQKYFNAPVAVTVAQIHFR